MNAILIHKVKHLEERRESFIQRMEISGIQMIIMRLLNSYMKVNKFRLDW